MCRLTKSVSDCSTLVQYLINILSFFLNEFQIYHHFVPIVKLKPCWFFLQITAAYFLIQSWLFYEVCSSPVKVNQQLSESQIIEGQALPGQMDDSELEKPFSASSATLPSQTHGSVDAFLFRLKRHSRHSRPCEVKRIRKWNDCLGRHFTEIHCRRLSVACLSPNNVPPKCKKTYHAILGKNGYCQILTSCTCAAWRHPTQWSCAAWRHLVLGSWNSFPLCISL